jgi:hypothetical protein
MTIFAEFLKPRPAPRCDEDFGGCPVCGKVTEWLNVGPEHWCICDDDLTKWRIGLNLFSAWREETREQWLANEEKLRGYLEVQPMPPSGLAT